MKERFTSERQPILFCYSLPRGSLGSFAFLDKNNVKRLKEGKQYNNRQSLTRMISVLQKEQEQRTTSDYKEQIKPIVDSIIKSLFVGENEKPLFKYDYRTLLNDQDKIELCKHLKYRKFKRGE